MTIREQYNRLHQIHNAQIMQFLRGTRAAAEYMRNLGWSIEATMWILCRK